MLKLHRLLILMLVLLTMTGCGRGKTLSTPSPETLTPEAPTREAPAPEVSPAGESKAIDTTPDPTSEAPSQVSAPAVATTPAGEEVSIHRGRAPSLTFGPNGHLWAAFEQEGIVYVTRSEDLGASFVNPVPVNPTPEAVEANGENRPKIRLGPDARVYVSWTRKLPGRFTGDIRFSRSVQGDSTFEPPRTVNDDGLEIGHRFESLHLDAAGHLYLVWIDKRDREAARERGEAYRGAAVYYTVSTDGGTSFAANRRVAPNACECCRIAVAEVPGGGAAVLWRHIFEPNIRDHAFAVLGPTGIATVMRRATFEGWQLDGCPHHGPAMALAEDHTGYHMTWFSAADDKATVYYGHFDPAKEGRYRPLAIAREVPAAHPSLVVVGERVHLAWKSTADSTTQVLLRTSTNDGVTWGPPRQLMATTGASDHPFLLSHGEQTVLSWHTTTEGLRVVAVN